MPRTEERLQEKVPFDVYGVMQILSFLIVAGAAYIIGLELKEHWRGFEKPEPVEEGQEPKPIKVAENLTKHNSAAFSDYMDSKTQILFKEPEVTALDKEEYKLLPLTQGRELKVTEYPEYLSFKDPVATGISDEAIAANLGKMQNFMDKLSELEAEIKLPDLTEEELKAKETGKEEGGGGDAGAGDAGVGGADATAGDVPNP